MIQTLETLHILVTSQGNRYLLKYLSYTYTYYYYRNKAT